MLLRSRPRRRAIPRRLPDNTKFPSSPEDFANRLSTIPHVESRFYLLAPLSA
jgi:hypothetical protein